MLPRPTVGWGCDSGAPSCYPHPDVSKLGSVAQPCLVAARYVIRVKAHVKQLTFMELNFPLRILSVTNELRNVTRTTRARYVGRNSGTIFRRFVDQSSPNQARSRRSDCSLQYRFPFDDILFRSRDIRDQPAQLSEICSKFWCFGADKYFGGGPPNFWQFIN